MELWRTEVLKWTLNHVINVSLNTRHWVCCKTSLILEVITDQCSRPGGTGPGPTFELGRIFFKLKKNYELFKIKSVYIIRRLLLTGK